MENRVILKTMKALSFIVIIMAVSLLNSCNLKKEKKDNEVITEKNKSETIEKTNQSQISKIDEKNVDVNMKAIAEKIGNNILIAYKEGRYETLGDEATKQVREGLTPEVQKNAHNDIKSHYGEFVSMEYQETWTDGTYMIFRFKAIYDKTQEKPEIRVVMNKDSKLDGLWLKPWKDELK